MGFSLYNLFKAGLLIGNGAAILHPKRVLAGYNLEGTQDDLAKHANNPLHLQAIGLLQAISYLKIPLIVCNLLVCVIEVFAG